MLCKLAFSLTSSIGIGKVNVIFLRAATCSFTTTANKPAVLITVVLISFSSTTFLLKSDRPYWAIWDEGGRYPDLIVELMSPKTKHIDLTTKFEIYEKIFATREYVAYDPSTQELKAWRKHEDGAFHLIDPDEHGHFFLKMAGLAVGTWFGTRFNCEATWLRFFDADGTIIPTNAEGAESRERCGGRRQRRKKPRRSGKSPRRSRKRSCRWSRRRSCSRKSPTRQPLVNAMPKTAALDDPRRFLDPLTLAKSAAWNFRRGSSSKATCRACTKALTTASPWSSPSTASTFPATTSSTSTGRSTGRTGRVLPQAVRGGNQPHLLDPARRQRIDALRLRSRSASTTTPAWRPRAWRISCCIRRTASASSRSTIRFARSVKPSSQPSHLKEMIHRMSERPRRGKVAHGPALPRPGRTPQRASR